MFPELMGFAVFEYFRFFYIKIFVQKGVYQNKIPIFGVVEIQKVKYAVALGWDPVYRASAPTDRASPNSAIASEYR